MKTIVIDMMGADAGVRVTLEGVKLFSNRNPGHRLILVGKQEDLVSLNKTCEIIDARDIVPMEAGAMDVLRLKNSSMLVAIETLLARSADAVVSAGSTGGFLSAATLKVKLVQGVERAALLSPFPSAIKGKQVIVLDIGANNENTPEQIVQFAKMGRIFAQKVYGIAQPNLYLLSNGTEEKKGSPEIKRAHEILKEIKLPGFQGNTEAKEALEGHVDVLVTGGYAGNVYLKATEGGFKLMNQFLKKAFKKNIFAMLGYLLVKSGIQEIRDTMDYRKFGGAQLLGLNKVVVKAHGSSDALAFSYAIEVALKMAQSDVPQLIQAGMKESF
jgi:glycerol-3-phosphate acyltransferase PlsX